MTVFGTRPEAIKMCPLVLEMQKYPDFIEPIVAVTAQHREMLDQVLQLFAIKPDYDLNIMTAGQTLYDVTGRALAGLKDVLAEAQPDMVLVHGDTTTTFVGALASFYAQIPVGHVEAGLRTGNKFSPYPEEMNRKLTGAIADIHFAPTSTSKNNLLKENIDPAAIVVTGNTVIDALQTTVKADYRFTDSGLQKALAGGKRLILVTTHRRENLGEPMRMCYTHRRIFTQLVGQLIKEGKKDKALAALDYAEKMIPAINVPYDWANGAFQMAESYYQLGQNEKANKIIDELANKSLEYMIWYLSLNDNQLAIASENFVYNASLLDAEVRLMEKYKSEELAKHYSTQLDQLYNEYVTRMKGK